MLQLMASGAQDYTWMPGHSLSCANCPNPVFTADTTTRFAVSGQDINGCSATDSLLITVIPEPRFDMPNAFTPNGDGNNDVFGPAFKGEVFTQYHLRIYARWGALIFESNMPDKGWNGRQNDQNLPSDVYVFVFDYQLANGKSGQKKGEVTLLR
jgi:gliding motility-associated-like protein